MLKKHGNDMLYNMFEAYLSIHSTKFRKGIDTVKTYKIENDNIYVGFCSKFHDCKQRVDKFTLVDFMKHKNEINNVAKDIVVNKGLMLTEIKVDETTIEIANKAGADALINIFKSNGYNIINTKEHVY
jgi:hypothetical protein